MKIHYFYTDNKYHKTNSNNATFRTLYGFEKRLKNRQKQTVNKLDSVIVESIIFDVDNEENVERALSDADILIKYLSDKYNVKGNVYYTGLKGAHYEIPLKEPLKLSLVDGIKIKIVKAYDLLLTEINKELNIESEIDAGLKEANRLIQLPNVKKKEEKGRTHKICIGNCRDLEKIRSYGNENNNIADPKKYDNLDFINHLKELDKSAYVPTLTTEKKSKKKPGVNNAKEHSIIDDSTNDVIISDNDKQVFVELYETLLKLYNNKDRHKIGLDIASSMNGYLTLNQVVSILKTLEKETDIEKSDNYYQSFIDAFKNDEMPNNLGLLNNKLNANYDALFDKVEKLLESYQRKNEKFTTKKNYESFKELLTEHNNNIEALFDEKLITYKKNSKALFKGVIYSLSSSFGWSSQIVNINAPSGVGKTEYVKTLNSMMPNFLMKGGGTAKSLYREDDYYFNLKSIYLGDWGLITDDEEKEAIIKIFRELMTDKISTYTITSSNNEDKITFVLKADALTLFITELYTKKYQFGLGEQLVNKSQNININELEKKDIIKICVLREKGENDDEFRKMHKDYVHYLLNNSKKIPLSEKIITELFDSDMRTLEMDMVYYKVFCIYFGYNPNEIENVEKYREYFEIKKLSKIEQEWLKLLENNFEKVSKDEINSEIPHEHIIKSTNTTTNKYHYFTVKRLKTYLNMRIKNNKTLKESVDYLTDILNVLLKKGYVAYTFEEDFGKERIYYLTSDDYYEEN